jgi:hypothetical protein
LFNYFGDYFCAKDLEKNLSLQKNFRIFYKSTRYLKICEKIQHSSCSIAHTSSKVNMKELNLETIYL